MSTKITANRPPNHWLKMYISANKLPFGLWVDLSPAVGRLKKLRQMDNESPTRRNIPCNMSSCFWNTCLKVILWCHCLALQSTKMARLDLVFPSPRFLNYPSSAFSVSNSKNFSFKARTVAVADIFPDIFPKHVLNLSQNVLGGASSSRQGSSLAPWSDFAFQVEFLLSHCQGGALR